MNARKILSQLPPSWLDLLPAPWFFDPAQTLGWPVHMNIVCLSHLRWDFVFQRPQHLLSRAARGGDVLYVEEPTFGTEPARLDVTRDPTGVLVAVPRMPSGLNAIAQTRLLRMLIANAVRTRIAGDYVLWLYTPMALPLALDLNPTAVVYDCMDELSAFAGASPLLAEYETELFR